MFTDMVGYSALTQRGESLALQLLEEHRRLLRPLFPTRGGREIKTIGDAFLVEFASALEAATCAVEMQQALHTHNLATPPERRIRLRIGLHAGDIVHREGDVFGDGVNIAARIEPLAEAGGICVSEDVARQIQNHELAGCTLVKLGAGELKNITVPVGIYRLVLPWQKRRPAFADRAAFFFAKKSVRRALVVVAAATTLLAVLWLRRPVASAGPAAEKRVAVLPLVNLSGEARDEYFADGMTEELISSLSSVRELSVIARTSITKFKGTKLDVAEIGRALSVGWVLEGTVRMAGEQARVRVSLVDVASQEALWTQEFTPTIKDVFAVQSAIAMSVSHTLKVRLLAGEKSQLTRRGAGSAEANREYLLGRSQLNKRTGDAVMQAIEHFTHAVAEDPGFALALAGLAEAYTLAGAGYGTLPRDEANRHARDYAVRAVELDDTLAEAHAALAYVKFRIDWNWADAETGFKRALALKPGYARAHEQFGLLLVILRRFPESMAEFQRARQLDPFSLSVSNGLGRVLHFERRYEEALAQFKRTLEIDPQFSEVHFNIGITYLAMGRYDDAIASLELALQLSNNRTVIVAMLGAAEGFAGRKAEARKIYDEMVAKSEAPYYLAVLSAGLGETDRAFKYFDEAFAQRDGILIYMAVEPAFAQLATDPRFDQLVKKMGLSL
jgi:TolB-like protein/class 3 adenylate cyclase/tetratricopeptide (TPR) repeat protein